jgi:uncharacterized iron-regulated membrane protein
MAGLFILLMCATGVLLTYEKQITLWVDQAGLAAMASRDAKPLPVEELVLRAAAMTGRMPASVTFHRGLSNAAGLSFSPAPIYFDPRTAARLGEGSLGIRKFFSGTMELHRYLLLRGASRPVGKAITGAANLFFLFLVASGFYLWWPRGGQSGLTWFRPGLKGKARDYNCHNVIGFWCCLPLLLIVLGATVISYPWASNLAYQVWGSKAPPPAPPIDDRNPTVSGMNTVLRAAMEQPGNWRTLTLRIPGARSSTATVVMDQGYGGQPQHRTTLTVHRVTGVIEKRESFDAFDRGRQFRLWLRFIHTGEYYGLPGQTLAGIATLAAGFLVYTGFALALRRLSGWRRRLPGSLT